MIAQLYIDHDPIVRIFAGNQKLADLELPKHTEGFFRKRDFTPIYLEAARRIDRRQSGLCCVAICLARHKRYDPYDYAVMLFTRMFADDELEFKAGISEFGDRQQKENQAHRIMALLWAAACWRDFIDD